MARHMNRTWCPLGLELAKAQIKLGIDIADMADEAGIKDSTLVRVMQGKLPCSRMLARVLLLTYSDALSETGKQMLTDLAADKQTILGQSLVAGLDKERQILVRDFADLLRDSSVDPLHVRAAFKFFGLALFEEKAGERA